MNKKLKYLKVRNTECVLGGLSFPGIQWTVDGGWEETQSKCPIVHSWGYISGNKIEAYLKISVGKQEATYKTTLNIQSPIKLRGKKK